MLIGRFTRRRKLYKIPATGGIELNVDDNEIDADYGANCIQRGVSITWFNSCTCVQVNKKNEKRKPLSHCPGASGIWYSQRNSVGTEAIVKCHFVGQHSAPPGCTPTPGPWQV